MKNQLKIFALKSSFPYLPLIHLEFRNDAPGADRWFFIPFPTGSEDQWLYFRAIIFRKIQTIWSGSGNCTNVKRTDGRLTSITAFRRASRVKKNSTYTFINLNTGQTLRLLDSAKLKIKSKHDVSAKMKEGLWGWATQWHAICQQITGDQLLFVKSDLTRIVRCVVNRKRKWDLNAQERDLPSFLRDRDKTDAF